MVSLRIELTMPMKQKSLYWLILVLLLLGCKPTADLQDSQGNSLYLSAYKGKWLVINYWATWCHPCLNELPELNALYQQHKNTLMVIGVNFDGLPNAEIRRFAQPLHLTFPLTSQFPLNKFGIKEDIASLPMTFLISPHGRLEKTVYGPQTQVRLWNIIQGFTDGK
jgi:peroxiredoxin